MISADVKTSQVNFVSDIRIYNDKKIPTYNFQSQKQHKKRSVSGCILTNFYKKYTVKRGDFVRRGDFVLFAKIKNIAHTSK